MQILWDRAHGVPLEKLPKGVSDMIFPYLLLALSDYKTSQINKMNGIGLDNLLSLWFDKYLLNKNGYFELIKKWYLKLAINIKFDCYKNLLRLKLFKWFFPNWHINSFAINILKGLMMHSLNFFLAKYVYYRFDNANQEWYKNKKNKINENQFKNPKLDIKSIILLIYVYYLKF